MPRSERPATLNPADIYRSVRTFNIPATPVIYGYHNTFHTHARPSDVEPLPPKYATAVNAQLPNITRHLSDVLPRYASTLHLESQVWVRCEMLTPFLDSNDLKWHDMYAILNSTQLNLYKMKSAGLFGSSKAPSTPNLTRAVKQYSLQHAELGLATDYRPEEAVPRSAIAKLAPPKVREKLWATDPGLFEPVREWVIRVRVELETLLIAFETQDLMLTWVEKLAAGIDLAPPLEDRGEPRYRSIPRRNRRQRQIEGMFGRTEEASSEDSFGSRLIEQQERLFRQMYPHLAASSSATNVANDSNQQDPEENDLDASDVADLILTPVTSRPTTSPNRSSTSPVHFASLSSPDLLEIPSMDSRFLSRTASSDSNLASSSNQSLASLPYNPKTARQPTRSEASQLRYRRRCAPILLAASPRASEIIFTQGQRVRLDMGRSCILPFHGVAPPRYEKGAWDGVLASSMKAKPSSTTATTADSTTSAQEPRPKLARGITERSCASAISAWSLVEEELDASAAEVRATAAVARRNSTPTTLRSSIRSGDRSIGDDMSIVVVSSPAQSFDAALPSPTISITASDADVISAKPTGAIRKARSSVMFVERQKEKHVSAASSVLGGSGGQKTEIVSLHGGLKVMPLGSFA